MRRQPATSPACSSPTATGLALTTRDGRLRLTRSSWPVGRRPMPRLAFVRGAPGPRRPAPSCCGSIVTMDLALASHRDPRRAPRPVRAASGCARGVAGRARRARLPRPPDRRRRVAAGRVDSIDDIGTLPRALRDAPRRRRSAFDTLADTERDVADGGLTEKALHRLADGALIESVLMHYPARAGVPRAAHAVHLEPGGLCGRLPVLRHRGARLRARPGGRRDRRSGPLRRHAG